jgi:hypothetical protein
VKSGKLIVLCGLIAQVCIGCMPDAEVTQSDVEKNQKEFSQEAYEQAMIKAGKGKELEEEKKRNAAYLNGGQSQGESQQ